MILLIFWIFSISHKSQIYSIFIKFHTYDATQFELRIKNLQGNNFKEFNNGILRQNFVLQMVLIFISPIHFGKAHHKIPTLNNIICTLLSHASISFSFLSHGIQMATFSLNILPSKTQNFLTPTQYFYNKISSYSHLYIFLYLYFPLFFLHHITNFTIPLTRAYFKVYLKS